MCRTSHRNFDAALEASQKCSHVIQIVLTAGYKNFGYL